MSHDADSLLIEKLSKLSIGMKTMFERLVSCPGHFKHQQRGEPDLSDDEKYAILIDLVNDSPSNFLARFGKYMMPEDLNCFDHTTTDYELNFRLKELKHFLGHRQTIVKNRRYQAMLNMTKANDYFTYDEMRHRDPLLYHQMVGQYLPEGTDDLDNSDMKLSSILMKHIELKQDRYVEEMHQQIEESQKEEEESSDDESETEHETVTEEERTNLRQEFLSLMQERFLMGQDKNFDYSLVDYDESLDTVDLDDRDEEDRYFSE